MKKISCLLLLNAFSLITFSQSNGALDTGFGNSGLVTVDNNSNTDDGSDLLLLPENQIMIGGTSVDNGYDFSFCVLNSSGSLSSSFGNGGKLLWDIDNGSDDYLNALALDSNQQIVAVGHSIIGGVQYITVVRLNAAGIPDNTFGTNGVVELNPALVNDAYDVAIQPDNKIVIGGYVYDGLTPEKSLIIRLNEDGSYDGAFGDNGVWEGTPSVDSRTYSIALQPDGKILLGGYHNATDPEFAIARLLPGGSMDVSFSNDGWVVKNMTSGIDVAHSIALDIDGKIVLAGESSGEVALWRINSNGTDDVIFANNGVFVDPLLANDDVLYDVIVQPDDAILAVGGGSIDDNVDFLLLRLTVDGQFDTDFGGDGVVYTDFNFNNDFAYSVLLQPDLKIVAGGSALSGYFTDFAVARYGNDIGTGLADVHNSYPAVYPNPAKGTDVIQISLSSVDPMFYDLMDVTGRIWMSGMIAKQSQPASIKLNNLPAGVYLLQLKDQQELKIIRTEKFVVK